MDKGWNPLKFQEIASVAPNTALGMAGANYPGSLTVHQYPAFKNWMYKWIYLQLKA